MTDESRPRSEGQTPAEPSQAHSELLDALDVPAMIIHVGRRIRAVNAAAEQAGITVGSYCWDSFGQLASIPEADKAYYLAHHRAPEGGTRCSFCRAHRALASDEEVVVDVELGGKVFETHWRPVGEGCYLHYAVER